MPEHDPKKDGAFFGQVFHLDKFKGIEPGRWTVDWKAELNRTVVLMVGMSPKAGNTTAFDLDAALLKLGYVKAEAFSDLIAIAEMMPEFNDPKESDAFAALRVAREIVNRATADRADRPSHSPFAKQST